MFAMPHPIKRKIDHQHAFISQLLDHFPALYKEWENGLCKKFDEQAKEIAEGDREIERNVYNNMTSWIDDQYDEIPLFYNSMAVTIYSYYENIVRLIAQHDGGIKELIKAVCDTNGVTLSDEMFENIDIIDSEMKTIRNQICHNNGGTARPNKQKILEGIAKNETEVLFEDGILNIHGGEYLKKVLDQEYVILTTLAEKLGYKTKRI